MGIPLTAADALKGLTFAQCLLYRDSADAWSLARNALNNRHEISRQRPFQRHVLETEIIDHSLDILDTILLTEGSSLIQMSEAAYLAGCRFAEGRLGEAVTLAWGVCEQLLSTAWDLLLNEEKAIGHMPSQRRKKLGGRDYTASVRTELLALGRKIEHDLYQHIEAGRRARNQWAHEMIEPDSVQVRHSLQAVEGLLKKIHGIQMSLPLNSPSPGVPEWNRWVWEKVKGDDIHRK